MYTVLTAFSVVDAATYIVHNSTYLLYAWNFQKGNELLNGQNLVVLMLPTLLY